MHKGRTFTGTVHFIPGVAAQTPALPLNAHQAKPAGGGAAPDKVAEQKPQAQPQRQHMRQQRQAPPAQVSLAQAAREAVTPPPAVVAARGKQVPASLAQEDKVSTPLGRMLKVRSWRPLMRISGQSYSTSIQVLRAFRCAPAWRTPW